MSVSQLCRGCRQEVNSRGLAGTVRACSQGMPLNEALEWPGEVWPGWTMARARARSQDTCRW